MSKPIGGGGARNPKSLANLQPGAGAWQPGAAPALKSGLRTRQPSHIVTDPIVREIESAIDAPITDANGDVPRPDRLTVELAAIQLLIVRRCGAFLSLHGDEDGRGNLRREFIEYGKVVERAAKMLDRLGCGPRARAALGVDLSRMQAAPDAATLLSAAREEPDPDLRRAMLERGGLIEPANPPGGGGIADH